MVLAVSAGYYVLKFLFSLHFVPVLVVVFIIGIVFLVFSVSDSWFLVFDVEFLLIFSCSHVVLVS